MRTRAPDHPSPARNMISVYNITGCRKKKRLDTKGVTTRARARTLPVDGVSSKLYKLRNQQKANPWRKH